MENQMENTMDNEMETSIVYTGFRGFRVWGV